MASVGISRSTNDAFLSTIYLLESVAPCQCGSRSTYHSDQGKHDVDNLEEHLATALGAFIAFFLELEVIGKEGLGLGRHLEFHRRLRHLLWLAICEF